MESIEWRMKEIDGVIGLRLSEVDEFAGYGPAAPLAAAAFHSKQSIIVFHFSSLAIKQFKLKRRRASRRQ